MKLFTRIFLTVSLGTVALPAPAQTKGKAGAAKRANRSIAPRPKKAQTTLTNDPALSTVAAGEEKIVFESLKAWRSARWYLVGRWSSASEILWLGGGRTRIDYGREDCGNVEGFGQISRPSGLSDFEVLATRPWVLVEIDPNLQSENFQFSVPGAATECTKEVAIRYGFGSGEGLKPILFFEGSGNQYFGRTFEVQSEFQSEKADIQLEILMGIAKGTFPNVAAGGKESFYLAPVAVARGEWLLPFYKPVGMTLTLEQTVANLGTAEYQSVFLSDWSVGSFYQHVFAFLDGLQVRANLKYYSHIADDNTRIRSLTDASLEARYLTVGFTTNFYFAGSWMIGGDVDYGFPGNLAGRGKSSLLDVNGRLGIRLTSFVYAIGELGLRRYSFETAATESVMRMTGGIRLDL